MTAPLSAADMPDNSDPFTITFAASGKPNAPTVTVCARTEAILELRLQALENNGTLATIARTANAFAAQFNVGDILGGKAEVEALQSTPDPVPAPAPQPEQAQLPAPQPVAMPTFGAPGEANAFGGPADAGAYALQQARQAPAAEQAVQRTPPGTFPAQQQDPAGQWLTPQPGQQYQAIPPNQPPAALAQPVQTQANATVVQPAPVQGGLPGQTGVDPQGKPLGPWLPGLNAPAVFVTGTGRSGEWRAWADPRSQQVTQNITVRTPNPDDPAIAAGAASFWDWIR